MSRKLFSAALLAMVMLVSVLAAPTQAAVPGKKKWIRDTRAAMSGSRAYVRDRVRRGGSNLAINLDIDNTSLATYYATGKPVKVVRRLARFASRRGVKVLFNTGRNEKILPQAVAQLRHAGFPVTAICGHRGGEPLATSKQRCRQRFVDAGYTIIANIGNRSTDFVGGNYERAFRLPNYGNQLG